MTKQCRKKTYKVLFLTGTRADFGKLKPLMSELDRSPLFEIDIFVTGMHMLEKYGYTCSEIEKSGFKNIYKYINQNHYDGMDHVISKTINGLADYIREKKPDSIVVHGDRVEALAGAIVGSLNNIIVWHVEGGEVSGTVDELIRHSVTKLTHVHFVANKTAQKRLIQMGEKKDNVYIIGSPDVDIMNSDSLPCIKQVKKHYNITFENYSILILHPVTTELDNISYQVEVLISQLVLSKRNYIVIYPNNDHGSNIIMNSYSKIQNLAEFKVFPSIRFESFLVLLKNADFIIGNSSVGVREASYFGVPAINVGTRQYFRVSCKTVLNVDFDNFQIKKAIESVVSFPRDKSFNFGRGNSARKFIEVVSSENVQSLSPQKFFVDF
jgi:UDP-N-acetylglucosamine 2-epimerase (hydrolysing)